MVELLFLTAIVKPNKVATETTVVLSIFLLMLIL